MTKHGGGGGLAPSGQMRSKVAITVLLAVGVLIGTAGVAMATSALSTDTSSSAAQYGSPGANPVLSGGPSAGTTPPSNTAQSAPGATQALNSESAPNAGASAPETAALNAGASAPETAALNGGEAKPEIAAAQAPRQLQASDELPFTGYASIAVLLAGLVLLASGLVIRRRTNSQATAGL